MAAAKSIDSDWVCSADSAPDIGARLSIGKSLMWIPPFDQGHLSPSFTIHQIRDAPSCSPRDGGRLGHVAHYDSHAASLHSITMPRIMASCRAVAMTSKSAIDLQTFTCRFPVQDETSESSGESSSYGLPTCRKCARWRGDSSVEVLINAPALPSWQFQVGTANPI